MPTLAFHQGLRGLDSYVAKKLLELETTCVSGKAKRAFSNLSEISYVLRYFLIVATLLATFLGLWSQRTLNYYTL